MIQTIKLGGIDKRLYQLIGPLVMDADVIRANNNYPFKTSENFTWFIVLDGKQVIGFVPVEKRGKQVIINNYYVGNDGEKVLSLILPEIVSEFGKEFTISSVTLLEDRKIFEQLGFKIEKEWKRYLKMKK